MNKDWTGNKNSVFKPLAASNHALYSEREPNDYYATEPKAIDCLLEGGAKLHKDIWEPACGEGHLSERLKRFGYNVRSTDLIDRGYGVGGVDFLNCTEPWHGDILTNPPYKYATEFVKKGLSLLMPGRKLFLFLKIQFLEGQARRQEIFDVTPPKTVYVFSRRVICAKNGKFDKFLSGGAVAYIWLEFIKGWSGPTSVTWIN